MVISIANAARTAYPRIVPASDFSLEVLNDAYNQARADYVIPMPMTTEQLERYIATYDVALAHSAVALEADHIVGLAMLGVRLPRTWITRLGILPNQRRHGVGQQLMEYLIEHSWRMKAQTIVLEVIKNNVPAYGLFRKLGFEPTRVLLVLQRPAHAPIPVAPPYTAQWLTANESLSLLECSNHSPSWLNEGDSLRNAGGTAGVNVHLRCGEQGWAVFQRTHSHISHLTLLTGSSDKEAVFCALLHALHTAHPQLPTHHENLPAGDPCYAVMRKFGYSVAFERIEMELKWA